MVCHADQGRMNPCVEKMLELVAIPLTHPEVYFRTGVQLPRGVLLHGPLVCGKTMLANAIDAELLAVHFGFGPSSRGSCRVCRASWKGPYVGPSRRPSTSLCACCSSTRSMRSPERLSQREMERRIVAQFLTCMDELS
ncbi:hypothetical protein EDB87DRAFT_975619 [Lactarius vividus]|nr:hypothetical protein EDB87DRAFT_975619 [Lactarius vividus]